MNSEQEGQCPCGKPSAVTVNGASACVEHLDSVISDRLSGLRSAFKEFYAQSSEDV